jgi:glycosyltransferase involved in cell wall biosynthesis
MVVPSLAESLPYVVLEAAAAGRPVIATAVGGIPEIFGAMADRLVPPGDASALAGAMQSALDAPEPLARQAAILRERIETHFSIEAMTNAIEALYRQAQR